MNRLCIQDLARITGGRLRLGSLPPLGGDMEPIGRVVVDARDVLPGDVFWSLDNGVHDRAGRAEEAFARGAVGIVTAGQEVEPWAGKFSILVDDARWALWQLAAWSRRQFFGQVITVAGELGKTTTQRMIDAVLGVRFHGASPGQTASDHLRVLLSMLALDETHDYATFEHVSYRGKEDHGLSHLCCPDIAVINRLAVEQLTGSDNEEVTHELGILESVSNDGRVVLNGDVPRLNELAKETKSRVLLVGRGSHCDVIASDVRSQSGELSFVVDGTRFRVNVWGRHHLHSALSAYAVGRIMNLSPDEIAAGLSRFRPLPGRCEVVQRSDLSVIDDTCDCRASSMSAALELLRDFDRAKRRIVVCGDLAGGDDAFDQHRRIGQAIVQTCGADLLVASGECGRYLIGGARDSGMPPGRTVWCRRVEEVRTAVRAMVRPGDVVLVKGSRNVSMEYVVDSLLETTTTAATRMAA